jgi:hypothetical protein
MSNAERMVLEGAAAALRAGQIGDGEFVRRTAPTWRREARALYRRWERRMPAWVEAADVEQEMALQALKYVRKWDAAAGPKVGAYVCWNAVKRAQRAMSGWRGASLHGNASKNAGHFEVASSKAFYNMSLGGESPELEIGCRLPVRDPDPVEAREAFEAVLDGCQTVREALVLLALRACEGSLEQAAHALYGDLHARVECGLSDERHARRVVGGALSNLVARASAA